MTSRLLLGLVCVVGCASDSKSSTSDPVLTGDTCVLYTDATTCAGDTDCQWLGTGCACPPNDPSCTCSAGSCVSIHGTGSGSGSGSGSTGAGCACSDGGVCYEQIGGPAQTMSPEIACTTPAPGDGDPCLRIENEGRCEDSTTVTGLCLCDNGIR